MATEDIDKEDILAVTQPFVSLMSPQYETKQDRCHHCLSACFPQVYWSQLDDLSSWPCMPRPVPCTVCSNVIYCSEDCREKSWNSYHQFECSQLAVLYKVGEGGHLPLRMLYAAGSKDAILVASRESAQSQDPLDLLQHCDPNDYYSVYRMATPEAAGTNQEDLMRQTINACLLAKMAMSKGFIQVPPHSYLLLNKYYNSSIFRIYRILFLMNYWLAPHSFDISDSVIVDFLPLPNIQ